MFGGVRIPAGASLFATFGAAHRQAEIFPDPHAFRLDRPPQPPHMNFGGGIFSCLGQFVASIEVEEAIARLTRRFPDLRVTRAERDFTPMFPSVARLEAALGANAGAAAAT